jgi:hypothetical protein
MVGHRHSRTLVHLAAFTAMTAVTVAGYLLWLGWNEPYDRAPGSTVETGPHEAWQIVGLALTLGLAAAIGGWHHALAATVSAGSLAITVIFAVDAATTPHPDANLWPIGAFFLFWGALAGLLLVSLCFGAIRNIPRTPADDH